MVKVGRIIGVKVRVGRIRGFIHGCQGKTEDLKEGKIS